MFLLCFLDIFCVMLKIKGLMLFLVFSAILPSGGISGFDTPSGSEKKYDEIINRAAWENGLDPALLKAVIKAESDFDRECVSEKGACGLMQIMPETAKIVSPTFSKGGEDFYKKLMSPEENIMAGARYLKDMIYLFNGDLVKALAAYNAGPSVVKRYDGIPPYKETQSYVRKVISHKKRYSSSSAGAARGEVKSRIYYYTAPDGSVVFFNK